MKLTGCKVFHKMFGNGTIVQETVKSILVQFDEKDKDGKSTKPFIFPDAFVKKYKYLEPLDENAKRIINKVIMERKCSVCKKDNVATELIDGRRFCLNCKNKYVDKCFFCHEDHDVKNMHRERRKGDSYKTIPLCVSCTKKQMFTCTVCNKQYLLEFLAKDNTTGRTLCQECFDEIEKICYYCGTLFEADKGVTFETDETDIHVCPRCLKKKTFICSRCQERCLTSDLVDSKFVPASEKVCISHVWECDVCGELIDDEHTNTLLSYGHYFSECYCPDCWNTKITECSYCGRKFYSKDSKRKKCSYCMEMEEYVARVERMNLLDKQYRAISQWKLERVDRCKLFTKLYSAYKTVEKEYSGEESSVNQYEEDQFHYLVLEIKDTYWLQSFNVVVTPLPYKVIGRLQAEVNVTMTKLRTRKGRGEVLSNLYKWYSKSTHFLETSAGRMKILNYPILLRVQTDYDKDYRKIRWHGPYQYVDGGNYYGDTTEFYIIGVLC